MRNMIDICRDHLSACLCFVCYLSVFCLLLVCVCFILVCVLFVTFVSLVCFLLRFVCYLKEKRLTTSSDIAKAINLRL